MSIFLNRFYWFGVVRFCTFGLDWQGRASWGVHLHWVCPHFSIGNTGLCSRTLCSWNQLAGEGLLISQQIILVWCSRSLHTWGQLVGDHLHWVWAYFSIGSTGLVQQGSVHLGSILVLEDLLIFHQGILVGVVGLCILGVDQWGEGLLILQQVILVWYSGDLYTWGPLGREDILISQQVLLVWCNMCLYTWTQLVVQGLIGVVGLCTLGINQQGRVFSFLNRLYWFGVVGLCSLELDAGFRLHCVCPYFSVGSTGLLQQGSVHLGLIGRVGPLGGSIYTGYVLISQQVILVWCSMASYTWA